jgi:glycerol-3-phosphate O-acyltransferase/dihydroxyacetone phosphate acyltransferase
MASKTDRNHVGGDSHNEVPAARAKHKERFPMTNWTYDLFIWALSLVMDLFFREVHPRGSWKIPRTGPVIFVAAPHANQVRLPLIYPRL